MTVDTGKGRIPLITLVAILSVSAIVSLPGLAISPILDDMSHIFPHARKLEISMLESLPSLMIIPFMLLAGRWSVVGNKLRILAVGTTLFLLSGIWSVVASHLVELIVASTLMGIGAGMIIPLSTGLIVDYFTGDRRVRQLGLSSAVNNLTLVVATSVVGYLADVSWHLAFIVYLLPAITLVLLPAIRRAKPEPEPVGGAQNRQTKLNKGVILGLMVFYFVITYLSLIVTFNTSYLAAESGIHSDKAGLIISLFFLAIMAPGLILDRVVALMRGWLNVVSLAVMGIGLIVMALPHATFTQLWVGALMAGLGYGVMQPVIYDKAATNAPPQQSTLALSLVMVVNYLAILVAPFLIDALDKVFHASGYRFAYMLNGIVSLTVAVIAWLRMRHSVVLGSDD